MKLEKVYDELYGMIEDLKKKIGAGGSVVTITPTLESGEKLADYSIDGTEGAIYAPPILEYYSTTPRNVGKWLDNSDVYDVVVDLGEDTTIANDTWTANLTTISNPSNIIQAEGFAADGGYFPLMAIHTSGVVSALACRANYPVVVRYLRLKYTVTAENRTIKKKK